jgi:tRNA dimethylallyltransferase
MDNGLACQDRKSYFPLEEKVPVKSPYKKKKVLVIAGPTACGKTALSILIGQAIGGEVISCDSMQIYKSTDIGTAKATREEQRQVPHHLIDICDIQESFNVASFYKEAMASLQEILLRDRTPIVVGGAGFYIHTFLYGPPKGPPSNREVRSRLEEDLGKFGAEMLYEKLYRVDPDYACTITVQDRQKIIRGLEIITLTGKKVSEIPKPSQEDLSKELDFRCWFLYYPREMLYERIDMRCEKMIEEGLVEEVVRLKEKGLERNSSASHSIGYRQCLEYLHSSQTDRDWDHFIKSFKQASRNYAKRQFTWFRKEPLFRWLNLSECSLEHAAELIIQDLEQH